MAERMYPVAAVAELLGVSRNTVYRLIASGDLAAVTLTTRAGQMRIFESELDRYQQSLTDE